MKKKKGKKKTEKTAGKENGVCQGLKAAAECEGQGQGHLWGSRSFSG